MWGFNPLLLFNCKMRVPFFACTFLRSAIETLPPKIKWYLLLPLKHLQLHSHDERAFQACIRFLIQHLPGFLPVSYLIPGFLFLKQISWQATRAERCCRIDSRYFVFHRSNQPRACARWWKYSAGNARDIHRGLTKDS